MQDAQIPRGLSDAERALLRWLLPEHRPGYDGYYRRILAMRMLGFGRWGAGDFIFGEEGGAIDVSGPMERVYAFGTVSYRDGGGCTITVHEEDAGQIEVQFAVSGGLEGPKTAGVEKKVCYSYWSPGDAAPVSGTPVRETAIDRAGQYILAVSPGDERLWLHEAAAGVNHLIPHMKFHNELMRETGARDAERVFNPRLLFERPDGFTGHQLRAAFRAYNAQWTKVPLPAAAEPPERREGFLKRLFHRKN